MVRSLGEGKETCQSGLLPAAEERHCAGQRERTWSIATKFSQLSPLVDEGELAQGHSAGDSARSSTGGPGGSCSYQGPPNTYGTRVWGL